MTRWTILLFMAAALTSTASREQTDCSKTINKNGYGKTIIGQTLIQDIIKENGQNYSLKTVTYLRGLANLGGGCMPMNGTKKIYRYKNLGIIYIVSSGDTVSGIIFYPPFNGQTDSGVAIGKNKINSLKIPRMHAKIFYSHPDRLGLYHNKKISENANCYVHIDGIYYGFKKSILTKNKFREPHKRITEIRIGG